MKSKITKTRFLIKFSLNLKLTIIKNFKLVLPVIILIIINITINIDININFHL